MALEFVVYTGGNWQLVNGYMEYVPLTCTKRVLEMRTDLSYSYFFSYVSKMCRLQNISRLLYKMSTFTDPIDIVDLHDLEIFFNMANHNSYEMFKLYVVEEVGVGSSTERLTLVHCHESCDDISEKTERKQNFDFDEENLGTASFVEGHAFSDKEELKLELGNLCLQQCFQYKVVKSSKSRFQASCLSADCDWCIRAYKFSGSSMFYVHYFKDIHTYSKTQTYPHLRQANKKVLGHIIKDQLKDSGRIYRGKEIMKDINERFKVNISYSQAWRGKSYAFELLRGSSRDSFSELPLYCHNLKKANLGTVTFIQTDELRRFEMVFIAIGAAIRSFMFNLRPLLIIDVAHLKGDFKGAMFLAVGMDGNNQILPVVYDIGKSESGESWLWFLNHLKECIGERPDFAIISDRAASIELAIRTVFPNAFHGLCCRHLMMNLRLKSKKAKQHESLWWKTCKAYRLSDFDQSFNALCQAVPRVKNTLLNVGLEKWEFPDGLTDLQSPLITKRQAGRPRENNRIMSQGEEPTPLRCTRCKQQGHHRNQCSQPMPSQVSAKKQGKLVLKGLNFSNLAFDSPNFASGM